MFSIEQKNDTERKGISEQEVAKVISWLKDEFADIKANMAMSKANKVIEAARTLAAKGMEEDTIAAEIASHAAELKITKQWIYRILPDNYKNHARSEGTRYGMSNISERKAVYVPGAKTDSAGIDEMPQNGRSVIESLSCFKWVVKSAKDGDCRQCQCINCQKLRGVDF